MISQSTPCHTQLLVDMDLKKDEMRISLQHPSMPILHVGPQFNTLDVSLNLASVPFSDKVNLHKKVGEILYNDLSKNLMNINRVETYIGKVSNKMKIEKANSRSLYLQKESYKELIIKKYQPI